MSGRLELIRHARWWLYHATPAKARVLKAQLRALLAKDDTP